MSLLEANLPCRNVSDLIFWPGHYFGDGDNSRDLTPKEILDIALAAGDEPIPMPPSGGWGSISG